MNTVHYLVWMMITCTQKATPIDRIKIKDGNTEFMKYTKKTVDVTKKFEVLVS